MKKLSIYSDTTDWKLEEFDEISRFAWTVNACANEMQDPLAMFRDNGMLDIAQSTVRYLHDDNGNVNIEVAKDFILLCSLANAKLTESFIALYKLIDLDEFINEDKYKGRFTGIIDAIIEENKKDKAENVEAGISGIEVHSVGFNIADFMSLA